MESTGRDARMLQEHLVGNSGAELAGSGKRPAKEQREHLLVSCVTPLFLEALTPVGEGSPCVRSDCEMTGLIPPRSWPACLSEHGVLKCLSSYVTLCDVLVAISPGLETV